MTTIKEIGAARLYEIQPGDATRYTIAIGGDNNLRSVFVAIGSGLAIKGGAWVPAGELDEFEKLIRDTVPNLSVRIGDVLADNILTTDFQEEAGIKNRWTCVVAICAALGFVSGNVERGVTLAGAVYREERTEVERLLNEAQVTA